MIDFNNTKIAFRSKSSSELVRSKILFQSLCFPTLVNFGPKIVSSALKVGLPIKSIIKHTLFSQFCAGESIEDSRNTVSILEKDGISSILDYAAEGIESEASYDDSCNEILRTIDEASKNKSIPYSVFKPTALARFTLMEKKSSGEPLAGEEANEWQRVENRWKTLAKHASINNVKLMVDAEETWIQPIIDSMCLDLMRNINKEKAIVFTTAQMYRKDRFDYLEGLLTTARNEGFYVGIKLVRGAYMEKERQRAKEKGYESPIHDTKQNTDDCFNNGLDLILKNLDHSELCMGTHNEESTCLLTKKIKKLGLQENDERIFFAQLFGMSDNLTYNLAHAGFNTAKYLPYGEVSIVMPYLFRRAEENSSIKGQASRELGLIESELKRRKKSID